MKIRMNHSFNRDAIGVRAHADGIGVNQANLSSEAVRSISRVQNTSYGQDLIADNEAVDTLNDVAASIDEPFVLPASVPMALEVNSVGHPRPPRRTWSSDRLFAQLAGLVGRF